MTGVLTGAEGGECDAIDSPASALAGAVAGAISSTTRTVARASSSTTRAVASPLISIGGPNARSAPSSGNCTAGQAMHAGGSWSASDSIRESSS
jgi:hypothetical protein